MKSKLKQFLLIIFGFVALWSCQQDDFYNENQSNSKQGIKLKRVSLDDIMNKSEHKRFKQPFMEFKEQISLKRNPNVQGKLVYNEELGLYVDDEEGMFIEKEDYQSYTFRIERPESDGKLENIVFSSKSNGEFDIKIVTYDITYEEIESLGKEEIATRDVEYSSYNNYQLEMLPNLNCERTWTYELTSNNQGEVIGNTPLFVYGWVLHVDCQWEAPGPGLGGGPGGTGSSPGYTFPFNPGYTFPSNPNNPGWYNPNNPGNTNPNNPGNNDEDNDSPADFTDGNTLITTPVISLIRSFVINDLDTEQKAWWNNPLNQEAKDQIALYLQQNTINNDIDPQAKEFAEEIINLARLELAQDDVDELVGLSILIENSGNNFFSEETGEAMLEYMDMNGPGPDTIAFFAINYYLKYRQLKELNPEWSDAECMWYAGKSFIHLSLDVFGLVPLIGEPADIVNGVLYTIEGDTFNATLSYASAVPVAGWVASGTKAGIRIVNSASVVTTKVKLIWKVDEATGKIIWGSNDYCRKKLRKVLGITSSSIHAHHIIPLDFKNHSLIQKAAKSGDAFHINETLNGIPLPSTNHLTGHKAYNNKIQSILTSLNQVNPNMNPSQAYDHIANLNSQIKNHIMNNPNYNLGQIANLIQYP